MMIGDTNPPFLSILILLVSMITSCKYYFIMHDVYPEGLVAVGKLEEKSFITKIWRELNRYSYQRATKLVVLGRDMKDLLIHNYGLPPEKIEYSPNWSITPTNTFTPFEKNDLARELNIQSKFVIQYSGNMGLWHDIDTFVRAAAQLKTNLDIQFLFLIAVEQVISNSEMRAEIAKKAKLRQETIFSWENTANMTIDVYKKIIDCY